MECRVLFWGENLGPWTVETTLINRQIAGVEYIILILFTKKISVQLNTWGWKGGGGLVLPQVKHSRRVVQRLDVIMQQDVSNLRRGFYLSGGEKYTRQAKRSERSRGTHCITSMWHEVWQQHGGLQFGIYSEVTLLEDKYHKYHFYTLMYNKNKKQKG